MVKVTEKLFSWQVMEFTLAFAPEQNQYEDRFRCLFWIVLFSKQQITGCRLSLEQLQVLYQWLVD